MRLAQIENGRVVNVIEVDPGRIPDFALGWPVAAEAGPGWTHDGQAFAPPVVSQTPIALLRAAGITRVNQAIGQLRTHFITAIPGQEMMYIRKEAEARAYLADTAPDLVNYPWISAEIGITGADADQVAQVYVNLAAQLTAVGTQLETLRLGTILAIEAAADPQAIENALAGFQQVLEAYPG